MVLIDSNFWFRFRFVMHRTKWSKLDNKVEAEQKIAVTKCYLCLGEVIIEMHNFLKEKATLLTSGTPKPRWNH